ncbi:tRNA guanosine(34) transglycosylase Tgt, partial [candidate division KSB1 bacterium]
FMDWKKPLLTDSGGFQAFSLGLGREHGTGKMYFQGGVEVLKKPERSNAIIAEEGIHFRSVYDQSSHLLTPESSIKIQEQLGADMILALDECTSPLSEKKYVAESLERTNRWAVRSIEAHKTKQALAGIIQGSQWKDLREKSAEFICSQKFDSIAIGGSLGKSKKDMHNIIDWVKPFLPEEKPRHLLGIGVVEDLFEGVERGIDLFDCVSPTRMARTGFAYITPPVGNKKNKYKYKLSGANHKHDNKPIDPNCSCKVCKRHSRAYINHLFKARELLAYQLTSYHNIHFFLQLMRDIRQSIEDSKFGDLKKEWGL